MNMLHSDISPSRTDQPGEVLRQARERSGLGLSAAAAQLNLTTSALRYLEAGEFDRLPGHTFARGYIRAYARLVGLDADPLVSRFDQLTGSSASGSEVRNLARIAEPQHLSRLVLRLVSGGLLLLLVWFGYSWWRETPEQFGEITTFGLRHIEVDGADGKTEVHSLDDSKGISLSAPAGSSVVEPVASVAAPVDSAGAAPAAATVAPAAPAVVAPPAPPLVTTAAPVMQPASIVPPPAATAPATPAVAASLEGRALLVVRRPVVPLGRVSLRGISSVAMHENQPLQLKLPASQWKKPVRPAIPLAAGEGVVELTFSGECWVQLTDARGKVVFMAVKRKGDTLQQVGKAPLELRLGNARVVEVSHNGAPVALGNITAGGTARLKLGQ